MHFEGRVGNKTGGGGLLSDAQSARMRTERLRQLAMETMDITKDPYFTRNHMGQVECKLCFTVHASEANYMMHTQAKRHQENIRKRAKQEADKAASSVAALAARQPSISSKRKIIRIGRPGYTVETTKDISNKTRTLTFKIEYPDGEDGLQPRHRFVGAYEQKVETSDNGYQYVVFSCDPYDVIGFKVPAWPIDRGEGRIVSSWDANTKVFTLQVTFLNPNKDLEK